MNLEQLKYPIGKFQKPEHITLAMINTWITEIHEFAKHIRRETENLPDADLNRTYRPDGWTIRQLVHHCADSHMNAFIRHKLCLTEDKPTIKPYREDLWAQLPDSEMPIASSLLILDGLCERWFVFLQSLQEPDFMRRFIHPESKKEFSLEESIGLYAWHGNHHLAHIRIAKRAE
ncbi:MAG TPA: putative metal-dependent hydrolase [Bacteroidia bacterium]|nr:putative metal-dependent hydrolase [Bacteroidia bacterium]